MGAPPTVPQQCPGFRGASSVSKVVPAADRCQGMVPSSDAPCSDQGSASNSPRLSARGASGPRAPRVPGSAGVVLLISTPIRASHLDTGRSPQEAGPPLVCAQGQAREPAAQGAAGPRALANAPSPRGSPAHRDPAPRLLFLTPAGPHSLPLPAPLVVTVTLKVPVTGQTGP